MRKKQIKFNNYFYDKKRAIKTRFFDFLGPPEDFAVGANCVLEGLNRGLVGHNVIQSRVVTELEIVASIEL